MDYIPKIDFSWAKRRKWLDPIFPLAEYQKRIENVQKRMIIKNLAYLIIYDDGSLGNIFYLSNFKPLIGDSFLFIPQKSSPKLFTNFVFHGEPMNSSIWNCIFEEVYPFEGKEGFGSFVGDVIRKKTNKKPQGSIGLIGRDKVPAYLLKEIQNRLSIEHFLNSDELILEERAIKSSKEIDCIEKASKISGESFKAILKKIEPGVTEKEIFSFLCAEMLERGAEEFAFPPTVVAGERSFLKHIAPSERPIREGDLVFIDFGAKYNGYLADISRCISVGKQTEEKQFLITSAEEIFRKSLKMIEPGISVKRLNQFCCKLSRDFSCESFFMERLIGHGIGLTLLEKPSLHQESPDVLEPGMVFAYEPMLVKENIGTSVIEDMVIVEEKGCRLLSGLEQKIYQI